MNPQQLIERAIYEAIRLKAVAEGLTPDITSFPDTEAGYQSYLAALKAIESSKGFAVEIFGNSSILSKGQVRVPRIVMEWGGFAPNDIGTSPEPIYSLNEDGIYDGRVYDISSDIGYVDIILVAEKVNQERAIQEILRRALPSKSYIPLLEEGLGTFLVVQQSAMKTSSPGDAMKEWVYSYQVPDIFWDISTVVASAEPITEVSLNSLIIDHLGITHIV